MSHTSECRRMHSAHCALVMASLANGLTVDTYPGPPYGFGSTSTRAFSTWYTSSSGSTSGVNEKADWRVAWRVRGAMRDAGRGGEVGEGKPASQ
eukprot:1909885-Prymnesium_polylepis.4